MSDKPTLPGKTEEKVIDVSLKQVIAVFGSFVFATLTAGVSIVLLRDHARYKRQKAVIDGITNLVLTLSQRNLELKPEMTMIKSMSGS